VRLPRPHLLFAALAILALAALGGCALLPDGGRTPTAVIDASRLGGPAPLAVDFDASQSRDDGEIVDIEWSFEGGASTPYGTRCAYVFRSPGAWVVSLTVTDAEGNRGSAHVDILVVNSPPVVNFRLSDDAPLVGEWVTVDGSASYDPEGLPIELAWDFGDGATALGATGGHSYDSVGRYTITLVARDASGGESTARHNLLVQEGTPGGGCSGGGAVALRR
jgi:PKD repeat protein